MNNNNDNKIHILLGFSGSVATIKYLEIIEHLQQNIKQPIQIKIIPTQRALHFMDLSQINPDIEVIKDQLEWDSWNQRGDPVIHIELRKWAHIFIIAPLSANTMAKLINGLCDNLLTCVFRAWDFQADQKNMYKNEHIIQQVNLLKFPIIVAPAMNTFMYQNPITNKQIKELLSMNVIVIQPIEKKLICGDIGLGAMQEPRIISEIVNNILQINVQN